METILTRREAAAAVILRRLVEQFTFTQKSSASMQDAMSRVPPPEREMYRGAIEALTELRMVGHQEGEIFVTQYGQLFLEFAVPSIEHRDLPLTISERATALSMLQATINGDARFGPQNDPVPGDTSAKPEIDPAGNPATFWFGVAIVGFIALAFLFQVLKRA
jgi:hypothetical protein